MNIPTGFAQVNYFFSGALPHGAQVTFGIENPNHEPPSVLIENMGSVYNQWIRPHASNQTTMSGILVKCGPNDTGASAEQAYGSTGLKIAGDILPNVALLVRKQTLLGGRKGRGRNYWPILGESNIENGGGVLAGFRTEMQDAMDSFLAAMLDPEHGMFLLHNDPGMAPSRVVKLNVDGMIATQRRRLRK